MNFHLTDDADVPIFPEALVQVEVARALRKLLGFSAIEMEAATEGFIGRLKTELFYPRDWQNITIEEHIQIVDSCIQWYNEKRIKISLGSLSSMEYRESLGLIA